MYLFASGHHEVMILRGTCPRQSSSLKTATQALDSHGSRSSVDFETKSTHKKLFESETSIVIEDILNPYEFTS